MEHESKNIALNAIKTRKIAHTYDIDHTLKVLLSYRGTFWPHVLCQYEIYVFPLLHTALLVFWQLEGTEIDGEASSGETGGGSAEEAADLYMLPWGSLQLLTPLMIFFVVFFISQCYNRFMVFFNMCHAIEAAVHDITMLVLMHVQESKQLTTQEAHDVRWDCVRYMTAAALVTYSRVTAQAEHIAPQMQLGDWSRMLMDERDWQKSAEDELTSDMSEVEDCEWERLLGWPRAAAEAKEHTSLMAAKWKTSRYENGYPPRKTACPPLLEIREVDELRKYPGGMMSIVLLTWCLQTIKESGAFAGPALGAATAAVFKARAATYRIRAHLSMPVPMPYFHALTMLQNINFLLYSWALCSFGSAFSPLILFVVVVITVGMREVGTALAMPFGKDDVDFPVDRWVAQLRGMALMVHEKNSVVAHAPSGTMERLRARRKVKIEDDRNEEDVVGEGEGEGGQGDAGDAGGDMGDGDYDV